VPMLVPRLRRHLLVLIIGLALAAALLAVLLAGHAWGRLAEEWVAVGLFALVGLGTLGVVWWRWEYRAVVVEAVAPRTEPAPVVGVQYMVVKPVEARWSTVYAPRKSPVVDDREMQMWAAAYRDDTGDIARMR
jgi:hypothetical protein